MSDRAPGPLAEQKRALRREVIARRNDVPHEQRAAWSAEIADRVRALPEFSAASCLAAFMSFGSEVNTTPTIEPALAAGVAILAPRVSRATRRLEWLQLPSLDAEHLAPGPWDIPEPRPGRCRPAALAEADLILCPGVAFDEQGGRLGYGGGFYDSALGSLRTAGAMAGGTGFQPGGAGFQPAIIALAFELQIVPHIPRGEHDLPVPLIVTERRTIRPPP